MKKLLIMAAFVLSVIILQMPQASASEVYAYTEARRNYAINHYVLTHTVQRTNYGCKVQLHAVGVKNDSTNKYWEVGFTIQNGDLYMVWVPSTSTTQITLGNNVIKKDYFNVFKILYESGALNGVM